MIERLLKSWTRVPLIVERDLPLIAPSVIGLDPSTMGVDAAARPCPMLAQEICSDIAADLQPLATQHFVSQAVRAPARLVGRIFRESKDTRRDPPNPRAPTVGGAP